MMSPQPHVRLMIGVYGSDGDVRQGDRREEASVYKCTLSNAH